MMAMGGALGMDPTGAFTPPAGDMQQTMMQPGPMDFSNGNY
jgi:hypothetical protein